MLHKNLLTAVALLLITFTSTTAVSAKPSEPRFDPELNPDRTAQIPAQTEGGRTPQPPVSNQQIPRFSDLSPNDWATESVESLLRRYGCMEGFPDGTFRGQEALTRYQFAAGMNACLDRFDKIIQERMSNLVTRDDLALLFRILSSIFEQIPEQPGLSSPIPQTPNLPNQAPGPQPTPDPLESPPSSNQRQ